MRLFLDNQIIAMATSCQVTLNNVFEDVSSKDSESDFEEMELVSQNWSINAECVVATDIDYGLTVADLKDMIGTKVQVNFAYADGEHNATMEDVMVNGEAIIASVEVGAPNRERSMCKIGLTGTGKVVVPYLLADEDDWVLADCDGIILTAE